MAEEIDCCVATGRSAQVVLSQPSRFQRFGDKQRRDFDYLPAKLGLDGKR